MRSRSRPKLPILYTTAHHQISHQTKRIVPHLSPYRHTNINVYSSTRMCIAPDKQNTALRMYRVARKSCPQIFAPFAPERDLVPTVFFFSRIKTCIAARKTTTKKGTNKIANKSSDLRIHKSRLALFVHLSPRCVLSWKSTTRTAYHPVLPGRRSTREGSEPNKGERERARRTSREGITSLDRSQCEFTTWQRA